MAEEVIHTRTFQVTVSFTDEQRDRYLDNLWRQMGREGREPTSRAVYFSHAIRSEIESHLGSVGLDASVTIVERMEVG